MTNLFRLLMLLTVYWVAVLPASAQTPKLEELPGNAALPKSFQVDKPYVISLKYTDPKGDEIKKSDALFIDQSATGRTSTPAKRISGDPQNGAIIEWELNKFEQGGHTAHFEVKGLNDTTRYPEDEKSNYEFVVESPLTKWLIFGTGALVSVVGLPLIVYLLARNLNPHGDPSRAAKMGLLVGILALCALFIYLFLSLYGPLVFAILIVGVLAAIVLLLRR